ncbi:acyl carrier protein [Endozoicomonas sp. SM1973]|uniref:Acyl carrier protein n=1 Tax=Spartinivicinus marinus TaxID=2994442 RepID=A0A853ID69_9GAMM|nr:acyl carrier protein [Spartinivicinus marinus]MCX4025415.1 acyl carrier protein [Spartinivicinus marinus]NYZ65356.1 acyl carrier protein [Spartinivicinus marinus]
MQSRQDILAALTEILVDKFEIDEADIAPEANLYEELDLDSIDAVDLVIMLQELTNKKIKPEEFKAVRTVNDVVNAVEQLVK